MSVSTRRTAASIVSIETRPRAIAAGQALAVGTAHHVDINAGQKRRRRRLDEIARDTVTHEFGDRIVVADDHAVEAKPRGAASRAASGTWAVIGMPAISLKAGMIAAQPAATAAAKGGK